MKAIRREIYPETRVIDTQAGTVEYIASDQTFDHQKEVIRADGWRFTHFGKNAPFVDSHDYGSIDRLLGYVVDYRVDTEKRRLVETVQWAKNVPENRLAQLGYKMTEAGFLRAVSVGFYPRRYMSKWTKDQDVDGWNAQIADLKLSEEPRVIFLEQEQIELSAVILGANPNALAKAYKADLIGDADFDFLVQSCARKLADESACWANDSAVAQEASQRTKRNILRRLEKLIKAL